MCVMHSTVQVVCVYSGQCFVDPEQSSTSGWRTLGWSLAAHVWRAPIITRYLRVT